MSVTVENDEFVDTVAVDVSGDDIFDASGRGELPIALGASGSLGGDEGRSACQHGDGYQQHYPPPSGTLSEVMDESSDKSA